MVFFFITTGFPFSGKATIAGSLIDLYVKYGNLIEARRVFNQKERDIDTRTFTTKMQLLYFDKPTLVYKHGNLKICGLCHSSSKHYETINLLFPLNLDS